MAITVTKISNNNRMNFLPNHFGQYFFEAEHYIYNNLRTICSQYKGGYWEYYELGNQGFYMTPDIESELSLEITSNGYQGTVSADAAGIITSLFGLNALCWKTEKDEFIKAYYLLRDFACEHQERDEILEAID